MHLLVLERRKMKGIEYILKENMIPVCDVN